MFGTFVDAIVLLAVAIIGALMMFRKLQFQWVKDGVNIKSVNAMNSIIQSLHEELALFIQANKDLRNDLEALQAENNLMREELVTLRNNVKELNTLVERRNKSRDAVAKPKQRSRGNKP